jgi:hypothetical protein
VYPRAWQPELAKIVAGLAHVHQRWQIAIAAEMGGVGTTGRVLWLRQHKFPWLRFSAPLWVPAGDLEKLLYPEFLAAAGLEPTPGKPLPTICGSARAGARRIAGKAGIGRPPTSI